MNKAKFYFELAKFAILNPAKGFEMLQSSVDVWKDIKKNDSTTYDNIFFTLQSVIDKLFPENGFSFSDNKKVLDSMNSTIRDFLTSLKNEEYPSKKKPYPSMYNLDDDSGFLLYAVCRILKPDIVVETGVAYGIGTSFILQALHDNNKGKLYSIDGIFRPWQSKEMIGAIIPFQIRSRWNPIYNSSSKSLKPLLQSFDQIDIFFHDSLHTYHNMMFEFSTAWPHIRSGGLLLSDDVGANNSFNDFCSIINSDPVIYSQKKSTGSYFGLVKK